MRNINYSEIEIKNKTIIDIAKKYMSSIKDNEHNINHMNDVVFYTKELLNNLETNFEAEVCIISAYWHDVGRIKINEGHEKISAEMLKLEMEKFKYNKEIIDKCYMAIEKHKWNMTPETIEGLIIKDADKIAWIGKGRWKSCLCNKQKLDELVNLLPRLRNEFLYFDESRKIYDKEIVELVKCLYNEYFIYR